jgi:hypothetical protein
MKARPLLVSVLTLVSLLIGSGAAFALEPIVVVATDKSELGPAASEDFLAWFVPTRHGSNVWAQALDGGEAFRVNPPGTVAFTGGIEGSILVYQVAGRGENPDLAMVDLATGVELDVPEGINTRRGEGSPSISGDHILFGRFARGASSVILFDTTTGTSEVIYERAQRERRFYDIIPTQVNANFAVWQQVVFSTRTGDFVAGDVFLYDIATGMTTKISAGVDVWEYGPSVSADGTVFFGRSSFACGQDATIVQRAPDGTETVIYTLPQRRDFGFSFAADNADGTTDVYFDRGSCRGPDFGDIVVLPSVD